MKRLFNRNAAKRQMSTRVKLTLRVVALRASPDDRALWASAYHVIASEIKHWHEFNRKLRKLYQMRVRRYAEKMMLLAERLSRSTS